MPTTEPSWRARTKPMSSGRSVRNATSVDPGFAKLVVSPYCRKTSNVASLTVRTTPLPVVAAVVAAGRSSAVRALPDVPGLVLGVRKGLVRGWVAVHHRDAHGAD